MRKLFNRAAVTVSVVIVVSVAAWFICPGKPIHVTLGTIANKQVDLSGRRAIIANVITGVRQGRFIVFDPSDDSRHRVIFSLADTEVEPSVTTFEALIVGLVDEQIPGCPHDPPFVYVIQARPVME